MNCIRLSGARTSGAAFHPFVGHSSTLRQDRGESCGSGQDREDKDQDTRILTTRGRGDFWTRLVGSFINVLSKHHREESFLYINVSTSLHWSLS